MTTLTDDRLTGPLAATLERFFTTKTSRDVDGTMSYFAPDLATYTDATLGWDLDSFQALRNLFEQYMPGWKPPARSYATAVFSNDVSALIYMVVTPELFGGELRILAAVDFRDGKIIRWVDYWDAAPYDEQLYEKFRTPDAHFPRDLKDTEVPTQAAPELVTAATALQHAFAAGDAQAAADLLHTDVVLVDMSLRAQLIGRIETARYLGRVLANAPYGQSSSLRHVVGGTAGGGFEWTSGPDHAGLVGITALELDAHQLITKITTVYDSRQLSPARRTALVAASTPRSG
jgi:ketosteroid isomerase-like protein